jgi:hypothetical protein
LPGSPAFPLEKDQVDIEAIFFVKAGIFRDECVSQSTAEPGYSDENFF